MGLMFAAVGLGQALNEMGDGKTAYRAAARFVDPTILLIGSSNDAMHDRIFKILDSAASSSINGLKLKTGAKPAVQGRIELRGVRFAYPSRPSVDVRAHLFLANLPNGIDKSVHLSLLRYARTTRWLSSLGKRWH